MSEGAPLPDPFLTDNSLCDIQGVVGWRSIGEILEGWEGAMDEVRGGRMVRPEAAVVAPEAEGSLLAG